MYIDFKTVPLVEIGDGGISADECKKIEKSLEHIPDIKSLLSKPTDPSFSWPHRRLLIGKKFPIAASNAWKGVYMIYLCRESEAGLAPNERLNEVMRDLETKGRATAREQFEAYGDAFVFRMKSKEPETETRAEYMDMTREFDSGSMPNFVLRRLLMYPWEQE